MVLALGIFVIVFALISLEKFDRTALAMAGAGLMLLLGMFSQEQAFSYIDFNTIILLVCMMLIVAISRHSGVFDWLAVKAITVSNGSARKTYVALLLITGVLSAFLDNVTTILIILPVSIQIARTMRISPVPFVIGEVFASNIGGTATLIGDPPNIMIAGGAGISYAEFLRYNGIFSIVLLIAFSFLFMFIYRKKLILPLNAQLTLLEKKPLDRKLLIHSLIALAAVTIGFTFHNLLHFESATVSLFGAAYLLLVANIRSTQVWHEVEWKTIVFFAALFVMVGGLSKSGAIDWLARTTLDITKGDQLMTGFSVLWVSAIASSFLDNIPFTAAMIPLIKNLGKLSSMDIYPLWWALSLGACFGGNGTIIGASANVVAVAMCEEHGGKITFAGYMKIAFPLMLMSMLLATIYWYLIFCL